MLIVATENSRGGETFVMNMPSCKIIDIAQVMIEQYGTGDVPIKQLGMRPGERLHETLISEDESGRSIHFDGQYFVILPAFSIEGLQEHYASCPPVYFSSYHSERSLMTKDEVRRMLQTGGFLA